MDFLHNQKNAQEINAAPAQENDFLAEQAKSLEEQKQRFEEAKLAKKGKKKSEASGKEPVNGQQREADLDAVKQEVQRQLLSKPRLAAIDAIGLFEGGLAEICDVTVAVTAPEESRIARLMARDGITEDYAKARIAAQKSQQWFVSQCDYVLENHGTAKAFSAKCLAFFRDLAIIKEKQL